MTELHELQHSLSSRTLRKRALLGAGIAPVLLAVLLLTPDSIDLGVWVALPMFTMSVAGALGGIYYHYMDHLRYEGSWGKAYAIICSILVYILLLWLSMVAALNVTGHWD